MATKKFDEINVDRQQTGVTTGKPVEMLEKGRDHYQQQTTASPEEQLERKNALKTQGRKGCKATRINMAFTPDNHEYIKLMAAVTGKSMTEVINAIIAADRVDKADLIDRAKQFRDMWNGKEKNDD